MKILLTGVNGQVGGDLAQLLPPAFPEATLVAVDREHFDLADPSAISRAVREVKPDVIINPAAYTAVDQAESERDLAHAINGFAPGVFAEEAKRSGALLIHYSTDYVFDGTATTPYREDAPTNPLGVYGASKLAGERAIAEVDGDYLILRTSWVYGLRGKNFFLTIRRLAAERDELRIVADQHGTPNWSRSLAAATGALLQQGLGSIAERTGLYHLSCTNATTWYGFTKRIVGNSEHHRVIPITTAEYPLPARRPAYAVLATGKLKACFGLELPAWEDALDACLLSTTSTSGQR